MFDRDGSRVSTEATFGRGDLSVCPLGGFIGAQECFISNWRSVPQGSPREQTLRALLLKGHFQCFIGSASLDAGECVCLVDALVRALFHHAPDQRPFPNKKLINKMMPSIS